MTDETEMLLDKQTLLRKTKAELVEIVVKVTDAYLHNERMLNFFRSRSLDDDEKSKRHAQILARLALPNEIAKALPPEVAKVRTAQAKDAAAQGVRKRPASTVKEEVRKDYLQWPRNGNLFKTGKSEFARRMVKKYQPRLVSERTVLNWCRAWDKEK